MFNRTARSVIALIAAAFITCGCAGSAPELAPPASISTNPGSLTVRLDGPGRQMDPIFYGLMTEEINHSYDGGIYAELIQNRIFQDTPPRPGRGGATQPANAPTTAPLNLQHWSVITSDGSAGEYSIDTNDPVNTIALTHSLKLNITSASPGKRVGVANDGYWGIPVRPNTEYRASFYARSNGITGPLTVSIESNDGKTVYASGTVPVTSDWKKHHLALRTGRVTPTADARFVISSTSTGTLWLSLVSLFPPTYNGTPNGNRIDIMELLADMNPQFLRFPGGNYVEGRDFANRFDWKKTIGPLEERPGHASPWNYRSSDGMGLLEFLRWCEDLNMEPILAVYAGMHLDSGRTTITGDALKPYVEEALEEIEYVMGDASTKWGAQRAKDGHPKPFKLRFVEIGNEDNLNGGLANYDGRFTLFYDAIKAKYPQLQVISTVPSNARNFNRTRRADLIDDHSYMSISAALSQAHRYDNYDRTQPRIFMGEWATRVGNPTPTLNAAVADGAFLTGLERNCDVVMMHCYAPLFINVNPYPGNWSTDLIGYDALTSYGSPSYYTQVMFAQNRGDVTYAVDVKPQPPTETPPTTAPAAESIFAVANKVTSSGEVILKVVNAGATPQQLQIDLQGVARVSPNATIQVMTGLPTAVNTVAEPKKISPREFSIKYAGQKFVHEFPAYSVNVIRLRTR